MTRQILFRECLSLALVNHFPNARVDAVDDVEQAIEACAGSFPDLVVLAVDPPNHCPPTFVRAFTQRFPQISVLAIAGRRPLQEIVAYLEAGASEFRSTDVDTIADLSVAIRNVLHGSVTHDANRTRALFARLHELSADVTRIESGETSVLSDRELEVLRLIDSGYSNKKISINLNISISTVKNHVHRILEKLEVSNRQGAVHLAYKNGWLKNELGLPRPVRVNGRK